MARRKYKRKRKSEYKPKWDINIDPKTKQEVLAVILIGIGVITLFSIFQIAGPWGKYYYKILKVLIGWSIFWIPIILGGLGYALLYREKYPVKASTILGVVIFIIGFSGILHLFLPKDNILQLTQNGLGGGFLGYWCTKYLRNILGIWVSLLVFFSLIIISILITFETSISQIQERLKTASEKTDRLLPKKSIKIHQPEASSKISPKQKTGDSPTMTKSDETGITPPDKSWTAPPLDLLNSLQMQAQSGNIKQNISIIQKTLANFGIEVQMEDVHVGPTVTQYTLKPAEGIKLTRITALAADLSLALAAHPIRIEAPIPGKSLVGIEVPNKTSALVRVKEIIESEVFKKSKSNLSIILGKDVSGRPKVDNLARMPHLLIAGATGSGKTICINSIITGLLYRNSPNQLKFILIDPKRVELPAYNGIPHLLSPVVVEPEKTISALKWAIWEMERRYKLFEKQGKRDIIAYNKTAGMENIPYIVTVIDELADLMVVAPSEVEHAIVRLSQMARATGIHLIIATQRPSVDILTGLIKANVTYRIAFMTASQVDSRTILDMAGAEKLLGNGDMLYLAGDTSKPKRIQGTYIDEKEIKGVTRFLKEQGSPEYNDEILQMPVSTSKFSQETPDDELYPQAAETVILAGRASSSLLQRRLKIGYARAARLIDLLEEKGIIGPPEGSKPRDVLIDSIEELEAMEEKEEGEEI